MGIFVKKTTSILLILAIMFTILVTVNPNVSKATWDDSGDYYYGDYSKLNHYFIEKYRIDMETDYADIVSCPIEEVDKQDLYQVLKELKWIMEYFHEGRETGCRVVLVISQQVCAVAVIPVEGELDAVIQEHGIQTDICGSCPFPTQLVVCG